MKGDLRCISGTLWRHDPQYDDPDHEVYRGACPECRGKGCESDDDLARQKFDDSREYEEELDRAWRAIDALGGVGATPSQVKALDDACAAIEALGGMDPVARRRLESATVLNVRPGENSLERFERIASAFYRETGLLAPGKDAPAAGGQPDQAERREKFDAWIDEKTNG